MDTLYPIDEAAKKLGNVSIHTVRAWLSRGRLRRTKVGRRTMIADAELQRFLATCADCSGEVKAEERAVA